MKKEKSELSQKEQVEIAKSCVLSDAELLEGGAEYKADENSETLCLEPTREQIGKIAHEMENEFYRFSEDKAEAIMQEEGLEERSKK